VGLNSTEATVATVIVRVIAATLPDQITTSQGIIQVLMFLAAMEGIDAAEAQAIQTDHPTVAIENPETSEVGIPPVASAGLGMTPRMAAMDRLMAADTRIEAEKAARNMMANTQAEASWEGETAEDAQVMETEMMTGHEMKGPSRLRPRIIQSSLFKELFDVVIDLNKKHYVLSEYAEIG